LWDTTPAGNVARISLRQGYGSTRAHNLQLEMAICAGLMASPPKMSRIVKTENRSSRIGYFYDQAVKIQDARCQMTVFKISQLYRRAIRAVGGNGPYRLPIVTQ